MRTDNHNLGFLLDLIEPDGIDRIWCFLY